MHNTDTINYDTYLQTAHAKQQESCAITNMTARCALYRSARKVFECA